jgi:hypothetical protein
MELGLSDLPDCDKFIIIEIKRYILSCYKFGADTLSFEIIFKNCRIGIRCKVCDLTSCHQDDIVYRYCAHCHDWHDSMSRQGFIENSNKPKQAGLLKRIFKLLKIITNRRNINKI